MSKYQFTNTWFVNNIPIWEQVLSFFKDKPAQFLELGSYEGQSACWVLDNILTHPDSKLYCCDPFLGSVEHTAYGNTSTLYDRFVSNIQPHKNKVVICRGFSHEVLKTTLLKTRKFHMIYVDADHYSYTALEDAVLAFKLLHDGGIMIFDDYEWKAGYSEDHSPKKGVDAFILGYGQLIDVIHKGYQVIIRKKLPSELLLPDYLSVIFTKSNEDPSNIELKMEISLVLYKLGKYYECIKKCDEVIQSTPDYWKAYKNKAVCLQTIGKTKEAIDVVNQAVIAVGVEDEDVTLTLKHLIKLYNKPLEDQPLTDPDVLVIEDDDEMSIRLRHYLLNN